MWTVILLSFGPVLLIAALGVFFVFRRGATERFAPIWIGLAVCWAFYFLVDLPDSPYSVGFHVGKLAFVIFTPLCAVAVQEWWLAGTRVRWGLAPVIAVIVLAGMPTAVIDLYNTQDIFNRARGPGYRWTVLLSPEEVSGLEWVQRNTPTRARVQVEPNVRANDTWAYVPAFAERRMSAGIPLSMIPLAKYKKASDEILAMYKSPSAAEAYERAVRLCVDYLMVGPPERSAYPALQPMIDASPHLFVPVFRNETLAVYAVSRFDRAGCPL
jgi:uncharacterized membrane protein